MIEILSIILITSLWVLGIKIVTHEDMALEKLGEWATEKAKSNRIFEPLLICEYCMPSIHSSIGYLVYWQVVGLSSWKYLIAYPIVVCGASFLSGSLWSLHNLLAKKHDYYENAASFYQKAEQEKYLDLKSRTEAYKKSKSKI